jgi:hypothetical protein
MNINSEDSSVRRFSVGNNRSVAASSSSRVVNPASVPS